MACLQIYRELLSLATFLRVHSNSKEVSYLSWQNTYPNLKTTCHIKLKFFLLNKLIENLLLAKYLISVTAHLMKIAEISSVFKKLDNNSIDNYRPISTLSNFTKLFESILFKQLSRYIQNRFSNHLTGFRKSSNTQNSLLSMIESWKVRLNNGSKVGVIIMGLSKAFDILNHELLLTKLKAYGLDSNPVNSIKSYLTNRLQCCKINNSLVNGEKYLLISQKDLF